MSNSARTRDGGYGWVCVGSCFIVNCFTWGVVASYGIYLSYYLSSKTFPESTELDYAFIGGLNFAAAMAIAPLVTWLSRKLGIHMTMSLGVPLLSGGFILSGSASTIKSLYITQGCMVGLGVGFVYIPTVAVLAQWFSRRRSLANGISAAGSGTGGFVLSLAAHPWIESVGLAWSLRIIGIVSFGMLFLAILLIRDRNDEVRPAQRAFDTRLLCHWEVALLLSWGFFSMLGFITLLFSLSDYAIAIGRTRSEAVWLLATLNLGTAIARPFIGIVSDRLGRIRIAALLTLACGISVFTLWLPSASATFGLAIFFALISGAILGTYWVTIGPLCVEVAGLEQVPSLLSLAWLSTVLPTLFSEVIALKLRSFESDKPYLYTQLFCGFSYIVASLCLWRLWVMKGKGSI